MITNSDGSTYRLRGPNPIMAGQSIWEGAFGHNLDQFEEVSYIPRSWKFKEIKNEEKKVTIPTPSAPNKVLIDFETPDKFKCWVLPTEFKTTVDPIYGDETRRLVWGNKFSMEVSIENIGDVSSIFWTNAIDSINSGSIFYVERRYWKVDGFYKQPEKDGIFIKCSISDQSPSFG